MQERKEVLREVLSKRRQEGSSGQDGGKPEMGTRMYPPER